MVVVEESVADAVEALVPLVAEHRDEGEATARLARQVVDAAGAAGMFRLFGLVRLGHRPEAPGF